MFWRIFKFYKKFISPILEKTFGHACRFTPTCSEYAAEAFKKYGTVKGGLMTVKRIVKCNPLVKAGYDPVL